MSLVIEEQYFTCSLSFAIAIFAWSTWHAMLTHTEFHNENKLDKNICHCVQWNKSDTNRTGPG